METSATIVNTRILRNDWHVYSFNEKFFFYQKTAQMVVAITDDVYTKLKDFKNNYSTIKSNLDIADYITKEALTLFSSDVLYQTSPNTSGYPEEKKVDMLRVEVTNSCNLNCRYCYGEFGKNTSKHMKKVMSEDTFSSVIKSLLESGSVAEFLKISFYGGEPLLHFDRIKRFIKVVEKHKGGQKVDYAINTNGTILNKEIISFLKKYKISLALSIDGVKDVHDFNRPFTSGEGTFGIVDQNVGVLLNNSIPFSVICCIEPSNVVYLYETVEYLIQKGVESIEIGDVFNYGKSSDVKVFLHDDDFDKLYYQLERLAQRIIKDIKNGVYINFPTLTRFAANLLQRTSVVYPCFALLGATIFVDTEGNYYPCSGFKECDSNFQLGDMETGLNFQELDAFIDDFTPTSKSRDCQECMLSQLCGGGCVVRHFALFKKFMKDDRFDPSRCRFILAMFKMLSYIMGELSVEELVRFAANDPVSTYNDLEGVGYVML